MSESSIADLTREAEGLDALGLAAKVETENEAVRMIDRLIAKKNTEITKLQSRLDKARRRQKVYLTEAESRKQRSGVRSP